MSVLATRLDTRVGWPPSVLMGSAALTLVLLMVLPLAHLLNRPDLASLIALRDVEAITLPPPAPPLFEPVPQVAAPPDPVRVELPAVAPPLPTPAPIQPALTMGLPSLSGDFGVAFGTGMWGIEDMVYTLADIDAPPRAMVQVPPLYPAAARQSGLEGQVVLQFVVTAEGTVTDISVVRSEPGTLFVSAARAAVERWRFEPAQRGGVPVAVRVEIPVTFTLDR